MSISDLDLIKAAKEVTFPANDIHLKTYPRILEVCNDPSIDDILHLIVLIKGWNGKGMDTLSFDEDELDSFKEMYEDVANENLGGLTLFEYSYLFRTTHEYTSFLHFMSPYGYPIYTDKVGEKLFGGPDAGTIKDTQIQIYIEGCQSVSGSYYRKLEDIVEGKLSETGYNYAVSKMRAIELTLHYADEIYYS